jgi:hypothetical protein
LRVETERMSVRSSCGFVGALLFVLASLTLALPAQAGAELPDEQALAERFAPVVRLVEQTSECGHGEPYEPTDVDLLFDNRTVALRGPWNPTDLVRIGPSAKDLVGLYEYHLDFPGDPLDPGCDYERWARRLVEGSKPTVYAHLATDPDTPGKLSLQYWFFYPFNDFNNTHEGDWEMIQLVFDARGPHEALSKDPIEIGYSSHEGAERAAWGDDKLEILDGTHPVVYPSVGSHANKFTAALYLGSSADAGMGCDDTRGPHVQLRPVVKTIPSDPKTAARTFPWITFEGRWGELEKSFFNGPTGPNLKTQWTDPIAWSTSWRERSYAVPTGGLFGTGATDFFCASVAAGSKGLTHLLRSPGLSLLVLGGFVVLLVFAVTRTRWRPATALRVTRRRAWGQILSSAGRMYLDRPRLFLGIGVILVPLGVLITVVQALVLGGFGLLGVDTTGAAAGGLVLLLVFVGTILALLGFALVQAATACALVEVDADRPIGPVAAYRMAFGRFRPLLGALALAVGAGVLLSTTAVLIPVAIWISVRWLLLAQAAELEDRSTLGTLGRSSALVRGHWLRVASLVGVGAVLALAIGPFLGALLILVTNAPLALLNVFAAVVYALAMPFVALTTTYVYFDLRVREALEPRRQSGPLPSELELEPASA